MFSETRENDPFSRCFSKKYICSFETTFDIYFLVAVIANWKGCFLLWQHGTFTETFHTHLFQLWCPTFDDLLEIISTVKVEWGQAKFKFGRAKSGTMLTSMLLIFESVLSKFWKRIELILCESTTVFESVKLFINLKLDRHKSRGNSRTCFFLF